MAKKFIKTDNDIKTEKQVSHNKNVSEILHKNIYDYSIDVAEDRALQSFRDGLKPSQRRLIKALMDKNANFNSKTVKSAQIVGAAMGDYHPHGDAGLAGALATLVNQQYNLVFGQGNWGSLTDGPASTRYTECKLSELGMKFIECYPVADEVPNYTGEKMEPVDFPTRFPGYFVNGGEGIAVGLSCKLPEHNLEEIVGALKTVLKKGEAATTKDILKHIKGPDYEYGGHMISTADDLKALYDNGHGKVSFECDYELTKQGRNQLLTITGYCPGFSPSSFQNKMISLIDEGYVIYANDCSTKSDPCRFEVLVKDEETFKKHIHKHLIKNETYQFYALDRTKSNSEDKDVDTKILVPNMVDLMNMWLDWRKEVETKVIDLELSKLDEKKFRSLCRLDAAENLDLIKKGLEADDTIEFFKTKMPLFKKIKDRAAEGAQYIADLKLNSIKKVDLEKIRADIGEIDKTIAQLTDDRNNIDRVVLRELDNLKKFFKPRKLGIPANK